MIETYRFQDSLQTLEKINAWQVQLEKKEEKQRFLIQEKIRKEQETKKAVSPEGVYLQSTAD